MIERFLRTFGLTLCFTFLTGCFGQSVIVVTATPSPTPTPISTITVADPPTVAPTMTPTPDPNAVRLWMSSNVPPEFQSAFDPLVKSGHYVWSADAEAQVKLVNGTASSDAGVQSVYAPVMAFPTIAYDVKWADIQQFWKGNPAAINYLSSGNQPPEFVTSPPIRAYISSLLGAPSPAVKIEQVAPDAVTSTLWSHRTAACAIVPFQALNPHMK